MKKVLILLLIGITAFTVTGCGKDSNGSDSKEKSEAQSSNTKKGIEVKVGQNIEYADNYNISFTDTNFSTKVEPTNPGSEYTYFLADNGNTFLVLKSVIKNEGADTLEGSKLPEAKLIYDNRYHYDAMLVTEEDDGSDLQRYKQFMNIEPLKTKKIWYLVEIPQKLETNSQTSLIMQYKINGKTYNVVIREHRSK